MTLWSSPRSAQTSVSQCASDSEGFSRISALAFSVQKKPGAEPGHTGHTGHTGTSRYRQTNFLSLNLARGSARAITLMIETIVSRVLGEWNRHGPDARHHGRKWH